MNETPALFDSLPPKPKVPGRLRTNEDWLEQQPELYQEVKDRIMGGDTNVSALAVEFAPQRWNSKDKSLGITEDAMRRSIKAMITEDITANTYDEITKTNLAVLRGETVDKASELAAKAKSPKDLGAVAMTMKLAGDTLAGMGGASPPVIRHEHLHVHTTPDALQRRREEARKRIEAESTTVLPAEILPQPETETQNHAQ